MASARPHTSRQTCITYETEHRLVWAIWAYLQCRCSPSSFTLSNVTTWYRAFSFTCHLGLVNWCRAIRITDGNYADLPPPGAKIVGLGGLKCMFSFLLSKTPNHLKYHAAQRKYEPFTPQNICVSRLMWVSQSASAYHSTQAAAVVSRAKVRACD